MKRLLVVPAIAALALSPTMAEAASFTLNSGDPTHTATYNTTHAQGTGACEGLGCEAVATFTLSGNTLTIDLTNTSTDGDAGQVLLTALFFDSTPDLTGLSAVFSGGMSTWELTANQGGFEINTSTKSGVNGSLDGGESGSVVITFSNVITSLTIDDSQVHFQALGEESDKLGEGEEGEEGEGEEGEGEEGEGETPEPASLLLLGSALTAAGFRLRRVRS